MSIIVALISSRGGVVSSDGRSFSSAQLVAGHVQEPVRILSESYDKTFMLNDAEAIGASCGLTHFLGRPVSSHISDISISKEECRTSLIALAQAVNKEIAVRLNEIGSEEVVFSRRKLDLLLVGRESPVAPYMGIASINFFPEGGIIAAVQDFAWADLGLRYYAYGDERAQKAAISIFEGNRAPNRDIVFLKSLCQKAVRTGIIASGTHPDGADKACGGKLYSKHISYR